MKHHNLPVRSIAKTITWRVSGSLATAIIIYVTTKNFDLAILLGSLEAVFKMILYYLHERAWERINFGKELE